MAATYRARDVLRHTFAVGCNRDCQALCDYLENRYEGKVMLCKNGRSALALALKAYFEPGDAVIVNGFTCYAVYEAVKAAGLIPVFADIDKDNLNFSVDTLEDALKTGPNHKKPTGIIVQNSLGNPMNITAIEDFAHKYDLTIIEDLAHCVGVKYPDGRECGTVGVVAAFSFGKDKVIDTISGGAVVFRGPTLHSVKTPSDSENASCYCCGGSQGCTYQWSEEPKNSSNCSKQPNVPKGQCIGTSSDLACRQCLIRAYEKAGLSEEQQACLAGSEIAKLLTQKSLEDANTEAADQDLETEREENRELVEEIYERLARKGQKPAAVDFLFGQEPMSCTELLGPNLTAVVHTGIKAMQIIGAILAIVYGMMSLIPAIMAKDADGLKKAEKKLVLMAIILLCIFLLPYLARFIGNIFDFDISCIV